MKRIILSALFLTLVLSAFSQTNKQKMEEMEERIKKLEAMVDELTLDDDEVPRD